jgi:MinD-like ATPase involved in chromosome partitioning or flagellar assembly
MKGKRVGIIDTDIQSPGIHVLFGLSEDTMGHTLNEYLRGECSIEEVAFNVGTNPPDKAGLKQLAGKEIFLVPSSIRGSEISRFLKDGYDPNKLNDGMRELVEKLSLDYLFIDAQPGLKEETLLSISFPDILILLMRSDNQDLRDTAVMVDIAKLLFVDHLYLLVNMALSKYNFDQIKADMQSAFDTPVLEILPFNEEIVELGSSDIFSLAFPNHPWSKAIEGAANKLLAIK